MAEFKNVFIKSKMNKDLDDRLLPPGEYRDALNIQVSKSESSDVGALENVLGNKGLLDFASVTDNNNVICVGYLVSEVNSCVFFFLTDNTIASNQKGSYIPTKEHFILRSTIQQGSATQNTILVTGSFLNFWEGAPIYGVNLLEDLLFWTDNRNQPRKINIQSAQNDITYYTIEDTISVAKYMPYNAPILWEEITSTDANDFQAPFAGLGVGDYQTTMKDVVSENLPDNPINTGTPLPGTDPTPNPYYNAGYRGDPDYLEEKFVRFSYRFKFDDGEYSLMAPFTQECFIPKQDGYFLLSSAAEDDNDMSAAYRSTIVDFMENKVNELTLLIDMPENQDPAFPATSLLNVTDYFKITEIEILFKESDGTAVLVVDTLSANEIQSQASVFSVNPTNTFQYTYSGTKPFRTLPEDDLVRVYDKVPVKALGQEIISNRVVYSNFQTRHTPPSTLNYNVGTGPKKAFDVDTPVTPVEWRTRIVEYPNSTLKQNRNYQAGFVLSDRFGRTTSTLLSNAATSSVGIIKNLSTIYSPYNDQTVDVGSWPGDALIVSVNETINETPISSRLYPGLYVGDPTLATYNPLGFNTWKIVVKQQEQDYYNVYLPGILAAYPKQENRELGLTSHVVLFNDNINKVPRDLAEVGPDQKQFRSSVKLFGRVQNTAIQPSGVADFGVVNQQYYPGTASDTVSTISNMFDLFNIEFSGTNPNLPSDYVLDFYEAESNPLIGRVSTTKKIGQTTPNISSYSIQNLAVYETEPVESKLDIYWETSTSGTLADLNEQVIATGNQTIFGLVNFNWNFSEYWGIQTAASDPWDPATTNAPEPAQVSIQPTTPTDENGHLGRFRSVIGRDTDLNSQFWFQDGLNVPVQNIEVVSFRVFDENNEVTQDFDLLQIYGTTSSPISGTGTYTNYQGLTGPNQTPPTLAFTHDTFIIVNKLYRVWKANNEVAQNFTVEIQVKDVAGGPTAPTFTKFFTPDLDNTVLKDEATIHVGAKQLHPQSPQVEWGQVSQPIRNYLQPSPLPPPAGIFFEYGETAGSLVQFFGMNGSNSNGNTGIGPIATLPNQNGLTWTITSQQQPFNPLDENQSNVSIFEINATTGVLTEITPGAGLGLYYLRIGLTSGDSTALANFNLKLTIGRPTATGSWNENIRGANAIQLEYDNSYIINLHNTLGNGPTHDTFPPLYSWAYAQLPIDGRAGYTGASQSIFNESYPEPGRLQDLLDPVPISSPSVPASNGNGPADGVVIVPGLAGNFSNNGVLGGIGQPLYWKGRRMFNSIPETDPSQPEAGKQTLNLQQAAGNNFDGPLTQGTGYINIEMILKAITQEQIENTPLPTGVFLQAYQKSEVSWAVEYREVINDVVQAWKAATDIEGNVLSWNTLLDSTDNDPLSNPQQSGLSLEGIFPTGSVAPFSDALHVKESASGGNSAPSAQQYGCATLVGATDSIQIPANFIRYQAENSTSNTLRQSAISKWVAVGNSPIYNTTPCFGEYRIIIQNIGGQSLSCQSQLVEFTNFGGGQAGGPGLQPINPFRNINGPQAGVINIGDFYYDLRPVDSPRAFGYIVHLQTFTSGTEAENMEAALDANIGNLTNNTLTKILYAEEGVPRYVSQFYADPGLTIPVTAVSSPTQWQGADGWIAYSCVENGTADYNVPYGINNEVNGQDPDSGTTDPGLTANMASENAANQAPQFDSYERRWACKMDVSTGIKYVKTSFGKEGPLV